jgi:hypothetical protein
MNPLRRTVEVAAVIALVVVAGVLVVLALTSSDDPPAARDDAPRAKRTGQVDRTPGQPTDSLTIPGTPSLERARKALLKPRPLDVLVVGDSSSNGPFEWPAMWARNLVDDREVRIRLWEDANESFGEALRPESSGQSFTLWNLSMEGVAASYGTEHLDAVPTKPELVLVNYGHFNTPDDIGPQLDALLAGIRERWGSVPVVLMLQNPTLDDRSQEQAQIVAYLRQTWSVENGVPTIDVESVFREQGDLGPLLADNTSPSDAGTALWTDEVTRQLTPGALPGQ